MHYGSRQSVQGDTRVCLAPSSCMAKIQCVSTWTFIFGQSTKNQLLQGRVSHLALVGEFKWSGNSSNTLPLALVFISCSLVEIVIYLYAYFKNLLRRQFARRLYRENWKEAKTARTWWDFWQMHQEQRRSRGEEQGSDGHNTLNYLHMIAVYGRNRKRLSLKKDFSQPNSIKSRCQTDVSSSTETLKYMITPATTKHSTCYARLPVQLNAYILSYYLLLIYIYKYIYTNIL